MSTSHQFEGLEPSRSQEEPGNEGKGRGQSLSTVRSQAEPGNEAGENRPRAELGSEEKSRGSIPTWAVLLVLVLVAGAGIGAFWLGGTARSPGSNATTSARHASGRRGPIDARIQTVCGQCHVLPLPSSFPKEFWPYEVHQGFELAGAAAPQLQEVAGFDEVLRYFQERAPDHLEPPPRIERDAEGAKIEFRPRVFGSPELPSHPGVSNVNWVNLVAPPPAPPDCLVCDMRQGLILLWRHDRPGEGLRPLAIVDAAGRPARVRHPAHAEVVDLDQDGHLDLVVADLGQFIPVDDKCGRVVWLRRDPQGEGYREFVLAEGLGRVTDVQPADFDGDGDVDLVAAVFGWRRNGQVLYLENRSHDYSQPEFHPLTLDTRVGAIHVPVADLNQDGRPDFIVLLSQHYEQIIAFLNEGPCQFHQELIHSADDPAYGSSGIALVDLDQDGDLDVLYTNGDALDQRLIKPYHRVQWLENEGRYPFRHHELVSMPGVHRALAGDLDLDGDLDIIAASFLPDRSFARERQGLPSILWLEQTSPGNFVPHGIEIGKCDHATADLADYDGDGDLDFVTGNFTMDGIGEPPMFPPMPGYITIWENRLRSGQ